MGGAIAVWPVCAGLLIAANFDIVPGLFSYDEQRVIQTGTCMLALAAACAFRPARHEAIDAVLGLHPRWRLLLVLVVLLGLTSAVSCPHPRAAVVEISHYALIGLSVLAVAGAIRQSGWAGEVLVSATLAMGACLAIVRFGAEAAALQTTDVAPVSSRAFLDFQNVRFFGQWLTWTLPTVATLRFLFTSLTPAARLSLFAVWACWWMLAFVAAGRGTLVAQAVALILVVSLSGPPAVRWARAHVLAAFSGGVLYLLGWALLPDAWAILASRSAHLASLSDSGRLELWGEAATMIAADPLLGEGPRAFAFHAGLRAAHPHAAVLQWAAEWGVPAAIGLSIVLLAGLVRCARFTATSGHADSNDSARRTAVLASLVAAAAHSFLSGIVVMPASQLLFVLTVGWALAMCKEGPSSRALTRRADLAWIAACFAAVGMWATAVSPELPRVYAASLPADPAAVYWRPRHWHDEMSALGTVATSHPSLHLQ